MKKWLWVVGVLLAVTLVGYQFRLYIFAAFTQPQMFTAPSFDMQPPELPAMSGELKILAIAKTNSYRHAAIPDASAMLQAIADERGWSIFQTENAAVFNTDDLGKFDLVVLNNATGRLFTADQEAAFVAFVENGGGVVGIHAAGDSSQEWDWYISELIRARFTGHPMQQHLQQATLTVEDTSHPATRHLAATWIRGDEWYNFAASPRGRVNVLISIDETTYDPESGPMGDDHPMVWWHEVGKGRVFYSALGHTTESYSDAAMRTMITQAMAWAARQESSAVR